LQQNQTPHRRQFLRGVTAIAAASLTTGCGSILYPERVGQPRGPLNWKVVALDTLGLLFFFVPGVIAFAVDFYNGTIYLPPEDVPLAEPPMVLSRKVSLPRENRSLHGAQEIVRRETHVELDLDRDHYLTRELASLSEVPQAAQELAREWQVRCQSPE